MYTLSQKKAQAKIEIVAHYYIDVELQGILQVMKEKHGTLVAILDSLAIGDYAVKICENGATSIACLGVDFMVKSVQAILKRNRFPSIPMYQLQAKEINWLFVSSQCGNRFI